MGAEIEQGRENRAKEIEYTMELNKKAYDKYIKQITPVNELGSDMLRAFVTGGIICALGQASVMMMMNYLGMEKEEAQTWMLMELILASVLLTGFGIYPNCKMGRRRSSGANYRIRQFRGSPGH